MFSLSAQFAGALLSAGAVAGDTASFAPPPEPVVAYFEALDRVYRAGSTAEDVEALMALMSDDVRYVHVNYEADFDLITWRAAFLRNLEGGAYQEPADFCSPITNAIPGLGYVAVEYARGERSADACVPEDDTRFLALFHIEDGKITLIKELW